MQASDGGARAFRGGHTLPEEEGREGVARQRDRVHRAHGPHVLPGDDVRPRAAQPHRREHPRALWRRHPDRCSSGLRRVRQGSVHGARGQEH